MTLNVLIENIHYETTFKVTQLSDMLFLAKCPDPPIDLPFAIETYTTVYEDDTVVYDCEADINSLWMTVLNRPVLVCQLANGLQSLRAANVSPVALQSVQFSCLNNIEFDTAK